MEGLPSSTNTLLIQDSLLYTYVNNLAVYKCPADRKTTMDPYGSKGSLPTVRSMSMNCWMNPINAWAADTLPTDPRPVRNFRKTANILKPTQTWVTLDENPASINDGWFVCDPRTTAYVDIPAVYHNGANGMSYADGHSEIKKWRDGILLNRKTAFIGAAPKDMGRDLRWLGERSTY